jgi:hypothetical protein
VHDSTTVEQPLFSLFIVYEAEREVSLERQKRLVRGPIPVPTQSIWLPHAA